MKLPVPSKEEWDSWVQHPCGQALQQWAAETRRLCRDAWESGAYSGDGTQIQMLALNVKGVGLCEGMSHVEKLDYEDIFADELEAMAKAKHEGMMNEQH